MRAAIPPRLLTRAQAAEYCGLSVTTFASNCPVRPLSLGPDARLIRYDIKDLDAWIDRLNGNEPISPEDFWLARLDDEPARGKRRAREGH